MWFLPPVHFIYGCWRNRLLKKVHILKIQTGNAKTILNLSKNKFYFNNISLIFATLKHLSMSGNHHDEHPSTEAKPISFTVPFILASVVLLIIILFLSLCDPKHGHHAEGEGHNEAATEQHHDGAATEEHRNVNTDRPVMDSVPGISTAPH